MVDMETTRQTEAEMTTQTAAEIQSKVDDHLRRVLDELEAGEAWAMLRYGDDRSQYEAPWVQVWESVPKITSPGRTCPASGRATWHTPR